MKIDLWPDSAKLSASNDSSAFVPYMETFLLPTAAKPLGLVVVLPGGGYSHRAAHEGNPVAERFNELGFHAVTVQYRVSPDRYPAALNDVARAIRIIRQNAAAWKVNPDNIAVCGFSAGGHLAGSSGLLWQEACCTAGDDADNFSPRPDAMLLCYPVIASIEDFAHKGSMNNLLGPDAPESARSRMGLQHLVDEHTPPAFIWHTATDQVVPVKNSVVMAEALWQKNIRCELHIFPEGPHGRGLGLGCHALSQWTALAANFLSASLNFVRG